MSDFHWALMMEADSVQILVFLMAYMLVLPMVLMMVIS